MYSDFKSEKFVFNLPSQSCPLLASCSHVGRNKVTAEMINLNQSHLFFCKKNTDSPTKFIEGPKKNQTSYSWQTNVPCMHYLSVALSQPKDTVIKNFVQKTL